MVVLLLLFLFFYIPLYACYMLVRYIAWIIGGRK